MNERPHRLLRAAAIVVWLTLMSVIFASSGALPASERGDFLIRGTVRIALLFWAAAAWLLAQHESDADDSSVRSVDKRRTTRLFWSLAALAYLIHVTMAFEHYHHWSHQSAFEHVQQVSGFGRGIFVSYAFTMLWAADTAWWWMAPLSHERRPRWLGYCWHFFMVFIIVNGTVIYESGPIRWVGGAVLFGLLIAWLYRLKRRN